MGWIPQPEGGTSDETSSSSELPVDGTVIASQVTCALLSHQTISENQTIVTVVLKEHELC